MCGNTVFKGFFFIAINLDRLAEIWFLRRPFERFLVDPTNSINDDLALLGTQTTRLTLYTLSN